MVPMTSAIPQMGQRRNQRQDHAGGVRHLANALQQDHKLLAARLLLARVLSR
jgi:hypothetical protein